MEKISKQTLIERIKDKISSIEQPHNTCTIGWWDEYLKDVDLLIAAINENENITLLEADAAFEGLNAVYKIRAEKKMEELYESMDNKLGLDHNLEEEEPSIDKIFQSLDEYSCWLELSYFSACNIGVTLFEIIKVQEKWGLCVGISEEDRKWVFEPENPDEKCTQYQAKCLEKLLGEYKEFDHFFRI